MDEIEMDIIKNITSEMQYNYFVKYYIDNQKKELIKKINNTPLFLSDVNFSNIEYCKILRSIDDIIMPFNHNFIISNNQYLVYFKTIEKVDYKKIKTSFIISHLRENNITKEKLFNVIDINSSYLELFGSDFISRIKTNIQDNDIIISSFLIKPDNTYLSLSNQKYQYLQDKEDEYNINNFEKQNFKMKCFFMNNIYKYPNPFMQDAIDNIFVHLKYICSPNTNILNMIAKEYRNPDESKKALRSHNRDRYIVVCPDDFLKIYERRDPVSTHKSPIPHLRRGHWRTLRATKWKEKQGKKIWIHDVAVKPGEEFSAGKQIYRVERFIKQD